jgi:hypothetical protein
MIAVILLPVAPIASCTAPALKLTSADFTIIRPGVSSLVVVHSRTGNTTSVGLHISVTIRFNCIRLITPDRAGDNYMNAPNRNEEASIEPKNVDMKKYGIVLLGSIIWLARERPHLQFHTKQ